MSMSIKQYLAHRTARTPYDKGANNIGHYINCTTTYPHFDPNDQATVDALPEDIRLRYESVKIANGLEAPFGVLESMYLSMQVTKFRFEVKLKEICEMVGVYWLRRETNNLSDLQVPRDIESLILAYSDSWNAC